jgi:hypothetical protein
MLVLVLVLLNLPLSASANDIIPPTTVITLLPSEPDGRQLWYVSPVCIQLNASDNESGVNGTYYRINNAEWILYTASLLISEDGRYLFEYYSVDNAGNQEPVNQRSFKIDQTAPDCSLIWSVHKVVPYHHFLKFETLCGDSASGIDYVEFYYRDTLVKNDTTIPYTYVIDWPARRWNIRGFIFLLSRSQTETTFVALRVFISTEAMDLGWINTTVYDKAGNSRSDTEKWVAEGPKLVYFTLMRISNNFTGNISSFHIDGIVDDRPEYIYSFPEAIGRLVKNLFWVLREGM